MCVILLSDILTFFSILNRVRSWHLCHPHSPTSSCSHFTVFLLQSVFPTGYYKLYCEDLCLYASGLRQRSMETRKPLCKHCYIMLPTKALASCGCYVEKSQPLWFCRHTRPNRVISSKEIERRTD